MIKQKYPEKITVGFQQKCSAGFTFFEVMVTVVILSVGILIIYRGFLTGIYYQRQMTYRTYAMNLIEHKIASVQYALQSGKKMPVYEEDEIENIVLNNQNIVFHFTMNYQPLAALSGVYEVHVGLSWQELGRTFGLKRMALISKL